MKYIVIQVRSIELDYDNDDHLKVIKSFNSQEVAPHKVDDCMYDLKIVVDQLLDL